MAKMDGGKRCTFRVRVQPGARRNEVQGFVDGVLRLRLTAPPVEGRANEALLKLLANLLGARRGQLSLLSGQTSREKVIAVEGMAEEEVHRRLRPSSPE
ncbi:MAG: DUF167 domain-containing protein [Chloroflexi bacterium]|nr:DUF167 domain-containing protein [Chloroflexota bacterium]